MRLEGKMRGGFYPAPPAAIALATHFLTPSDQPGAICDPCAGEGEAIGQLATRLELPYEKVWAIEIEPNRATKCAERLPGATIANASALGMKIQSESFSFVWCNPPFDAELGGGRMEHTFLTLAHRLLVPGGILAWVVPEHVTRQPDTIKRLYVLFEQVTFVDFPPQCRRYRETIVFGVRREHEQIFGDPMMNARKLPVKGQYKLPPAPGPGSRWKKTEPTPIELFAMLRTSPLRTMLSDMPERELLSPPMALGTGHLALMLSCGQLDGEMYPPNEPPHVVRGTARKRKVISNRTIEEQGNEIVTTEVETERIEHIVRAAWQDGTIRTYSSGEPEPV